VGKAVIRQVSFTQLDEVVKILNEYTDYNLTVAGHTDNSGTIGKNQILSEQRAAAIKTYFVSKGFDAARIETAGYGDTKPLMPNTNAKNKAINRRVELNLKLKE
jgi:outer membrane protein OmpA-like peptidoglycan-associated protein